MLEDESYMALPMAHTRAESQLGWMNEEDY